MKQKKHVLGSSCKPRGGTLKVFFIYFELSVNLRPLNAIPSEIWHLKAAVGIHHVLFPKVKPLCGNGTVLKGSLGDI